MESHGDGLQLLHTAQPLVLRRTFGPRDPRHLDAAHSARSDEGAP